MTITVEDMLKLPQMSTLELVAGSAGLWRGISGVNVMEVPDISQYVRQGELLITTMYSIRDDDELQRGLIPLLCEKNAAALVVVPLYQDSTIPTFMQQQADELTLPLLQAPHGIAFSDIMSPILRSIVRTCQRSELVHSILQGRIISLAQVLDVGHSFGCNLEGAFIPVFADGRISIKVPPDVLVAAVDSDAILLFPLKHMKNAAKRTEEIAELLTPCRGVSIGIGHAIESIIELPRGIQQAKLATKLAQRSKAVSPIVAYNNMGIYRILLAEDAASHRAFAYELLSPIISEPMLLDTLREYFSKMGNYRSVAKSLYVHHNTVANRLTRIEQLTGLSLDDPDSYLCLHVALKIYDLDPA